PEELLVYLPQDMPAGQFDVVVANILAGPLVELAPELIERTRSGGRIALSGILAEQAQEVRDAYSNAFILAPTAEKEGWVCISGVRI
ncbi:MAG TPA: 50S ribosomal protein L11 methyltransferase, partial [Gammaproteobacteria bacterium]|nr:50S ribosomal protein L11 methyltransferase [Gammaproteobacteria bacterium]